MPSEEVVVIGGGLAGSAAAISLALAGCKVVLLERASQPQHKVCGEFLSHEALQSLRSLGVDPAALGACPVGAVRLAAAHRVTNFRLPFAAMSMTRLHLDEELLRQAERAGATVRRGTRVLRLQRQNDRWSVVIAGQDTLAAKAVFLATGKHDLAEHPRPAGIQSGMVGFKTYFRLQPRQAVELAGHIELVLFRGGYAGLQLVEDGSANLGLIVQKAELQRLGGRWDELLARMKQDCPHLANRLRAAEPLLQRPLAVSSIPYGYVRPTTGVAGSGAVWALGDQAAVIPSFTGDGMAIALHSGQLAAAMYLAGESAEAYQRRLHGQLSRQVALATVLSRGLVWRPSRAVFMAVARLWPATLAVVARYTRIADGARLA